MTTLIAPLVPSQPPTPPLLTAEEFVRRYPDHGCVVELVRGVVKVLPMPGLDHGFVCSTVSFFLNLYVREHNIGRVPTNDTSIKTYSNPDSVRAPDVAYFSYERLPKGRMPRGLPDVSPEITVEVRSPSDSWTDVFAKVIEFLGAKVRVVIVLDPDTLTASVYRPDTLQEILRAGDTLTIPDVLPGFAVAVDRLFE